MLDIEALNAQSIGQKLAVEGRKLAVEQEYARKALDIQIRRIELEKQAEISKWKLKAWLAGKDLQSDEVKGYVRDIEATYGMEIKGVKDAAASDDLQRTKQSEIAKGRIVLDHNRQIYDSLKQQAGGVFDAMLTKSQSVFGAIGNAFKTAILTAIKDIVTSRIAAALMQLMGGGRVSFG
ncbi:MAG: hypothetical protein SGI92_00375, partial [Bryobacteraceae bacterium]|nr:hypothetical protein [Bryobacteraceae bacterium]